MNEMFYLIYMYILYINNAYILTLPDDEIFNNCIAGISLFKLSAISCKTDLFSEIYTQKRE